MYTIPQVPCTCGLDANFVEYRNPTYDSTVHIVGVYRCLSGHIVTIHYPNVPDSEMARRNKPTTPPPFPFKH